MRGKLLLLLHQKRLVQLALMLLDLLLHVGDCTCNLGEKGGSCNLVKCFTWQKKTWPTKQGEKD